MKTIPGKHTEDLDLHALRVLDVLFRERSITRAADALHTQQPALSKYAGALAPLFQRPPVCPRRAAHGANRESARTGEAGAGTA
ncbi:helix-turn-helix domain-containing protein [Bradyrhizobium vignae]|uniref:helix-turn-helix domain-containing protein n=1 Tax=Bradyrhizobium vignae TaxID=1549949 RepID=UPI00100B01F9|nr:LysR family transcriptional regulator [Bradyrhizobium vignae]